MAGNRLIENLNIDPYYLNTSNWPIVLADNMPPDDKALFFKRKKAIDLYMNGSLKIKEIGEETSYSVQEIRRLVKRCLELAEDGSIWGYRALIPNKRINSYERKDFYKNTNKMTGLFSLLMDTYPIVKEKIDSLFLNNNKDIISEPVIRIKYLHKAFLDQCRFAGLKPNDYPFNTRDLGRRSLYRYINKLSNIYFLESAKREGENVSTHIKTTGIGKMNRPMIIRPFERVEFDGHRIDAIFSITYETTEGDETTEVLERIWLLAIIDVATRTILGYHLCLNREYAASDVLHCIRNATIPKQLKSLTIPALQYPENGGFTSIAIPETEWAIWDEFCYDNGKANLSDIVRDRLTQFIGCSINAGPVKTPTRRSLIERFFGILEENGYHRLPNTTGSNPKDPRRKNPEEKAIKYNISFEHLEELTEVLIANYNNTPNDGINNLSPLEVMQQRISRGLIPRTIPLENRNDLSFFTLQTQRVIKGGISEGKRPYLYYEGVVYRNDVLARSPNLIGIKLDILVNIDDLRAIRAFLPDGSEFGLLTATGKWGVKPHSLNTRKHINKLRIDKLIHFTSTDDPIEIYNNFLQSKAKNSKVHRNRLASLNNQKQEVYCNNQKTKNDNQDDLKVNKIRELKNCGHKLCEHKLDELKDFKTIVY